MTENEKLIESNEEAIDYLKKNKPTIGFYMLQESVDMAIKALEEIQKYPELYISSFHDNPGKSKNWEIVV